MIMIHMIILWISLRFVGVESFFPEDLHVCLCVNPKDDEGRMKRYDTARVGKMQLVEPFFAAQDRCGKMLLCSIVALGTKVNPNVFFYGKSCETSPHWKIWACHESCVPL